VKATIFAFNGVTFGLEYAYVAKWSVEWWKFTDRFIRFRYSWL